MVQGVGFRPFICRLAAKHALFGEVDNRTDGVSVIVQGDLKKVDSFSNDILLNAPPASQIKSIEIIPAHIDGYESFSITGSKTTGDLLTEISPDIAVCEYCLEELGTDLQRINYPFINCTNCGPRFTIIEGLPYDREMTSMKRFNMCPSCKLQYNNILDRRFHAQPIACNSCGPVYTYKDPLRKLDSISLIMNEISDKIASGKTIAVKGLGGYHLMCDALNNNAVRELRQNKQRDLKPFAVLFKDISAVKKYCFVDETEEKEIKSWRRPVIILRQRKVLSDSVSNGLKSVGAMLPYMPFHHMLFKMLQTPAVVLTSGNISEEPVITDDREAEVRLSLVTDSFLSYNRTIVNRTDDSVVRIVDRKVSIIRRSRGYVPRPVDISWNVDGILALGAEQKNSFCIGKGNQAVMSQYIGEMRNPETFRFFINTIDRFSELFRFRPRVIACDLHPDYMSTQHAHFLENKYEIPVVRIQHHHAHIASCMAENGLDEEVIGISLDGTGFGSDGNIWGGEFLINDLRKFTRFTHFDYIPMPGGDKAIDEPWRMAFSYIYKYFGENFDYNSLPLFNSIDNHRLDMVKKMIFNNVNTPLTSGAGRLFDAVSAILGLCPVSSFDSEAPMRLESAIDCETDDYYPFSTGETIVFAETLKGILNDLNRESISLISAKFHNTIAQAVLDVSCKIRRDTSIAKVILSGGVFQNKYLLEKTLDLLRGNSFKPFTNHHVPVNDGGISLGQLVITSKIKP